MITARDEVGIDTTPLFELNKLNGLVRSQRHKPDFRHNSSIKITDTTVTPLEVFSMYIPPFLPFRTVYFAFDVSNFTTYNFAYDVLFSLKGEEMLKLALEDHNAVTAWPATVDAGGNPVPWGIKPGVPTTTQPSLSIGRKRADGTGVLQTIAGFPVTVTADKISIRLKSFAGSVYGGSPDATFFVGVSSDLYRI